MTKQISKHAAVAKLVKQELKALYPDYKFQVKSTKYAGGTSVSVDCVDSLAFDLRCEIRESLNKYVRGSFCSMTDCYEFTNKREDIPQVSFLFVN